MLRSNEAIVEVTLEKQAEIKQRTRRVRLGAATEKDRVYKKHALNVNGISVTEKDANEI